MMTWRPPLWPSAWMARASASVPPEVNTTSADALTASAKPACSDGPSLPSSSISPSTAMRRRAGCNRCRIWRHLADKRPNGRCQADRTGGACRYKEKIASRGFGRGRCVSCCHFVILAPSAPSAGLREEMFASVIPEFGWRRWLPSRSSNVIDRYRSQKLPISRRHVT